MARVLVEARCQWEADAPLPPPPPPPAPPPARAPLRLLPRPLAGLSTNGIGLSSPLTWLWRCARLTSGATACCTARRRSRKVVVEVQDSSSGVPNGCGSVTAAPDSGLRRCSAWREAEGRAQGRNQREHTALTNYSGKGGVSCYLHHKLAVVTNFVCTQHVLIPHIHHSSLVRKALVHLTKQHTHTRSPT